MYELDIEKNCDQGESIFLGRQQLQFNAAPIVLHDKGGIRSEWKKLFCLSKTNPGFYFGDFAEKMGVIIDKMFRGSVQ